MMATTDRPPPVAVQAPPPAAVPGGDDVEAMARGQMRPRALECDWECAKGVFRVRRDWSV